LPDNEISAERFTSILHLSLSKGSGKIMEIMINDTACVRLAKIFCRDLAAMNDGSRNKRAVLRA